MSYYNQDLLDAKITTDEVMAKTIKEKMNLTDYCFEGCGRVDFEDHFLFKYQLVLEGETAPWQRPAWIMLGGFVMLRQESPQHQWFYSELKPWKHYVPIAHDLSDLLEKIKWLREHDDEAHKIAQNGQDFAHYYFRYDRIENEFKKAFQEYHDVYNKDIIE